MESREAVAALSALAHASRLNVFRLLVRMGPTGVPAGEIAEDLRIAPATLSFHLSQLTRAGLLEARRSGRSVIYSLRPTGIQDLLEFLVGDCCRGRPELCAPAVTSATCCAPRTSGTRRYRKKPKT